jgi:hypothetical protein
LAAAADCWSSLAAAASSCACSLQTHSCNTGARQELPSHQQPTAAAGGKVSQTQQRRRFTCQPAPVLTVLAAVCRSAHAPAARPAAWLLLPPWRLCPAAPRFLTLQAARAGNTSSQGRPYSAVWCWWWCNLVSALCLSYAAAGYSLMHASGGGWCTCCQRTDTRTHKSKCSTCV